MKTLWIGNFIRLVKTTGRITLTLAVTLLLMGADFQSVRSAGGGINMGTAANFAVLGGQTVTNSGPSVATGHLGVAPGSAVTGFPPGIVLGEVHAADAVAIQAQADALIAYNALASQACDTDLTGQDLGGLTLTVGVYCFSSSAQLTGPLTLDAQGDPDAQWIFQVGSSLNSASASSVQIINGGNVCNLFWQIGSSATLGTGNAFSGNILALASISLASGSNLSGRALANVGSVTLDTNAITRPTCATPTAVELSDLRALPANQGILVAIGTAACLLLGVALKYTRKDHPTMPVRR